MHGKSATPPPPPPLVAKVLSMHMKICVSSQQTQAFTRNDTFFIISSNEGTYICVLLTLGLLDFI